MKSFQKLRTIILLMLLFACSKEIDFKESVDDYKISNREVNRNNTSVTMNNIPVYSPTELIIQYRNGVTNAQKVDFRRFFKVKKFEVCKLCPDKSIEKWIFEYGVDIEHKKVVIEQSDEDVIEGVDNEFTFTTEFEDASFGSEEDDSYLPFIKTTNNGVTIAVLDTGFDPNFSAFFNVGGTPSKMLYNASVRAVASEKSGYDFVNKDNNAYDDNAGKHGTEVTNNIKKELDKNNIPYNILPIKVCKARGSASYFTILCGVKYALERAHILQMSLGWYNNDSSSYANTIFRNLLDENPNVLVVASAGNGADGSTYAGNNDILSHYPSSFVAENVVAVAAANEELTDIASFSNYGINSVDFYAAGEGIPFYNRDGSLIASGLSGTSFAAPKVTAIAAKYLFQSGMTLSPSMIVTMLDINGIPVSYTRNVKYNKLID